MSSQVGFRGLMFSVNLGGSDGYHLMHRLLPSSSLRTALRDRLPRLGPKPTVLGTHEQYRWLATSKRTPRRLVLLVERADGAHMGVEEGLRVERAALGRASGLTGMTTDVKPYDMVPESAADTLRDNIRNRRRWSKDLPR